MKLSSVFIGASLLLTTSVASSAIINSSDVNDFNLTAESFNYFSSYMGVATSISGNITLQTNSGNAYYHDGWTSQLSGGEYAISDRESFTIGFSSLQNAFAMNYVDTAYDSLFTLNFYNGTTNVGSTTFDTSAPFNIAHFIGFSSDTNFNKVVVSEAGPTTTALYNEYFQFYTAENKVPEPSILALMGLGIFGLGLSRRKMKS